MPAAKSLLNLMSTFAAVVKAGSFTRAAEELNLTQGAISRQIKLLEDQLGITLFERVRQRIIITAGVPLGRPGATNMLRIAFVGPPGRR